MSVKHDTFVIERTYDAAPAQVFAAWADPAAKARSTVELVAEGEGTRLVYTEQGAFLDGLDKAQDREHGTAIMLDGLGRLLAGERANA